MRPFRPVPPFAFAAAIAILAAGGALGAEPTTSRTVTPAIAGTILGRTVRDSAGAEAGQLVDLLVDKDGKPVAGVLNIGGFLGVGAHRIAVAWRLLRVVPSADDVRIVMDLTLDAAAAAPEMPGPDRAAIIIDRPGP